MFVDPSVITAVVFLTLAVLLQGQIFQFENSHHPYFTNTYEQQTFTATGAVWWTLTFDSSTFTEYWYDFLEVYQGFNDGTLLYRSSGSVWPQVNITCGPTLTVVFVSDIDVNKWGVKL
jgi:hypothetical protein